MMTDLKGAEKFFWCMVGVLVTVVLFGVVHISETTRKNNIINILLRHIDIESLSTKELIYLGRQGFDVKPKREVYSE